MSSVDYCLTVFPEQLDLWAWLLEQLLGYIQKEGEAEQLYVLLYKGEEGRIREAAKGGRGERGREGCYTMESLFEAHCSFLSSLHRGSESCCHHHHSQAVPLPPPSNRLCFILPPFHWEQLQTLLCSRDVTKAALISTLIVKTTVCMCGIYQFLFICYNYDIHYVIIVIVHHKNAGCSVHDVHVHVLRKCIVMAQNNTLWYIHNN